MKVTKTSSVAAIEKNGVTGANALWDGPLDTDGFPKGNGSSSGKNGIVIKNSKPIYKNGPITQRAKCY